MGFPINEHRTSTAGTLAASVLHGREAQLISQKPQQLLIFFGGHTPAVHRKDSHTGAPFPKVNLSFFVVLIIQ